MTRPLTILHAASVSRGGAAIAMGRIAAAVAEGVDTHRCLNWYCDTVVPPSFSGRAIERARLVGKNLATGLAWRRFRHAARGVDDLFTTNAGRLERLPAELLHGVDLVHFHWIARGMDVGPLLLNTALQLPVVWTLHDMNPFTGGCHYSQGCERFRDACGHCPLLTRAGEDDLSRWVLRRKQRYFDRTPRERVVINTYSRWMETEAKSSRLLGRFPAAFVPLFADSAVFQPQDRAAARRALGVDPSTRLILVVADGLANRRKGYDLLWEALRNIQLPDGNPTVLMIGRDDAPLEIGVPTVRLGYVSDPNRIALAYNAADLFICPSREENFAQTALEAVTCGCPVISFSVGGLKEIVIPGTSGFLATDIDSRSLREVIRDAFSNPQRLATMRLTCARFARETFSAATTGAAYRDLYASLIDRKAEAKLASRA